jgi:hypothetical protein
MTKEELKSLVDSDTQATAMAEAGNYADCALWCSEHAPKVPGPERRITALSLLRAFGDHPEKGADAWRKLKQVGEADNPMGWIVSVALEFMGPSGAGLDIAHPSSQGMCDALLMAGVWSEEQANTIKALGLVASTITAADVEQAMGGPREIDPELAEEEN